MKTRIVALTALAALAGTLVFSAAALGARPPDAGNGGGGSGHEPPDYGDLIILYRDPSGVPHLNADGCWQPIPSDTCPDTCVLVPGVPMGQDVVPVDPATCAVLAECALCAQEVEFGRINEGRSPDAVFEAQLEDVVVNLATADCVTLDPAGRLVTSTVVDGEVLTSEIDSPLQNLSIYRQLMLAGYLGSESEPLELPGELLDTAARALGAASDKTGEVNVDVVAYLNQILGLSDPATPTVLGKFCIDIKEEVKGQVQLVEKCFLDYGAYGYDRSANFLALPAPAYIPGDTGTPEEGWFEYLGVLDPTLPTFEIARGPILTAVFDGDLGFTEGNVGGFAQAADDARAVINFMHDWPVPDEDVYATPVPCLAAGAIGYDVSISDVSGLQVPKIMVDGTEGREFTVNISNEGPDAATGTVTVTATAATGGPMDGSPWTFEFSNLAAGASQSWIEFFSINLGERTQVTWTATVYAMDDVNDGNNSVTETTIVKLAGGGGRH